jgi:hypothetical protein
MIKRLKQISFSVGIFGFTLALFFFGLNFGLGIGWEITFKDNRISGTGPNIFEYMGWTYFLISVCLLLFIALQLMRDKVFLKSVALVPLVLMLLQCRILIAFTPEGLPDWVIEYSSWVRIILYADFFFVALTIALLALQFFLIWSIHRSPIYNHP